MLTIPYESDPFEFNATNFQSTIFLEMDNTFMQHMKKSQIRHQTRDSSSPNADESSYWGYKFETLSLLSTPWDAAPREAIEQRVAAPVSNYEQFCSIVQTGVGDIKLVLAGEVDGVWDDIPEESDIDFRPSYVELKTSLLPDKNPRSQQRFEQKLNKFWAQSYLLGVARIIVGFRGRPPGPKLIKVETFETKDIPTIVQRNCKTWESRPCIYALAQFLGFLKANMSGKRGVWKVRRVGSNITLQQILSEGVGGILTPQFMEWRSGFDGDDRQTLSHY